MRHGRAWLGGNRLAGPRELSANIIPGHQDHAVHGHPEGIIDGSQPMADHPDVGEEGLEC